jgi:predicted TIM-barrel fold metal-dependent hydrolase
MATTRRQFVSAAMAAAAIPELVNAQEASPKVIDAWGHVSLPRFLSAEEYLAIMDANNVEMAVVGTAATCPDLAELSRTAVRYGDRFRTIGMSMGRTPQEKVDCVSAQMDCGFMGIRLETTLVVHQPELLDIVGKAHGIPYMEGRDGYSIAAPLLLQFLDRYKECAVCGTHFAGPTDPAIFTRDENVAKLFRHPRFYVIFSRQGYMEPEPLKVWTRALIALTGWNRIIYGSEFPVALWRDETFRSTQGWIDACGLKPTPEERRNFFHATSRQLFFSKPRPAKQIDAKWCRTDWKTDAAVWLFQKKGMDLPEEAHRKILRAYLAKGGDARVGSYRDFVTNLVVDMANRL